MYHQQAAASFTTSIYCLCVRAGSSYSRRIFIRLQAFFAPWYWRSFYKKLKNVSCEYDRLNGWNSSLQAAWYIRHVRWTCLFYVSFIIWFLWAKPTTWLLILSFTTKKKKNLKTKFGRIIHDHTKKSITLAFRKSDFLLKVHVRCFAIFRQLWPNITDDKKHSKKGPMLVRFFVYYVVSWRTPLPNFVFQLVRLLESGRKKSDFSQGKSTLPRGFPRSSIHCFSTFGRPFLKQPCPARRKNKNKCHGHLPLVDAIMSDSVNTSYDSGELFDVLADLRPKELNGFYHGRIKSLLSMESRCSATTPPPNNTNNSRGCNWSMSPATIPLIR